MFVFFVVFKNKIISHGLLSRTKAVEFIFKQDNNVRRSNTSDNIYVNPNNEQYIIHKLVVDFD